MAVAVPPRCLTLLLIPLADGAVAQAMASGADPGSPFLPMGAVLGLFAVLAWVALCLIAGLLCVAHARWARTRAEVTALRALMVQRLAEQASQLNAQHARLRDQALLAERQRLMQDMHDGLGSALLSALLAVEQGAMAREAVVLVLRECVDDLRLVIDSLEPVGRDLVALLATLRYRLGRRLQQGGLVVEWDVQNLPPLDWLEPPAALQVLRLMQEALSNVIKHARARRVRVATRHLGDWVEIHVEDNGRGFDVEQAGRGRGLASLRRRADRLGGILAIDSAPGRGTHLCLRLPVERNVPSQQHGEASP
jgi:signal transduction histidine kinase